MTRLRGRALRGQRVHDHAPCARWKTTTMISSIRSDGKTECMTIQSATDADIFHGYIKDWLCPTLRPGDIVIMDNLSAHKGDVIRQLISATGACLEFLPAYSPDLNPIEKMWSKVKNDLRRAKARTPEELERAIGVALNKVTSKDALNWFVSCGYNFI